MVVTGSLVRLKECVVYYQKIPRGVEGIYLVVCIVRTAKSTVVDYSKLYMI
jgi:hypothetical protein